MISFIISTRNPQYLKELEQSIAETVGSPYEIIAIQNGDGAMGISRVYNTAARNARYDIFCFIHEDVLILSREWGAGIVELFTNDPEIGLIGVAGSKFKPEFITGWTTGIMDFDRANIYHYNAQGTLSHYYLNASSESLTQVVVLDGVCIFMKKDVWEASPFNEDIKGFHFYDLDLSLRVHAMPKKVMVTFNLSLLHKSLGNFNDSWFNAAWEFHKHQPSLLPSTLAGVKPTTKNRRQIKLFWLRHLQAQNISKFNRMRLFVRYGVSSLAFFYYRVKASIANFLLKKNVLSRTLHV